MKTRKTVIAVLTVTALITAALIASCISPVDGLSVKPGTEDNFIIPEGKGIVKFKVSDEGARTVFPATNAGALCYQVEFQPAVGAPIFHPSDDGGTTAGATKITHGALTGTPFSVAPGGYTVIITAYDVAAGTNAVAGWTSPETVTISTGTSTPINANLIGFTTGADGIFNYAVTIPAAVVSFSTCEMVITKYPSGAPATRALNPGAINNQPAAPGNALPPGYYTVVITVAETGYQTTEYVRVVHIYPTLTSTMTISLPALVKNVFQVTFDLNGKINTATGYNGTAQTRNYAALATDPGDPDTAAGDTFIGWYKEAAGTNLWTFATSRVLGDQTLYAKWIDAGTPSTAAFTLTFTPGDLSSITGAGTINRNDFDGTKIVTLTLPNPTPANGGGTWSGFTWYIQSLPNTNTTNTFTITNDGIFIPLLKKTSFEATVTATLSGNTDGANGFYSGTVTVDVTD